MSEIIRNVIPPQLASEIEWHLGHSLDYVNVYGASTANTELLQLIDDATGEFAQKIGVDPTHVYNNLFIVERGGTSFENQDRDLHQDGNERITCVLSSFRRLNAGTVCVEGIKAQHKYRQPSEKILTNRTGILPYKSAQLRRKHADLLPIKQAPHRGAIRFSGTTYHFAPALPRNTGRLLLLVNGE